MLRCLSLLLVLALSACAESRGVAADAGFVTAASALLRGLAPQAAPPPFQARTCGAIFDPDPDRFVASWAEGALPGTGLDAVRRALPRAGWQLQRDAPFPLLAIGPDGARFAILDARAMTYRIEHARCSIAGRFQRLHGRWRPLPTALQQQRMQADYALVRDQAQRMLAALERDTEVLPVRLPVAHVHNCLGRDSRRPGTRWRLDVTVAGTHDPGTSYDRALAALTPPWLSRPRPRDNGYVRAERDGLSLTMSAGGERLQLELHAADCIEIAPEAARVTAARR